MVVVLLLCQDSHGGGGGKGVIVGILFLGIVGRNKAIIK